MKLEEIRKYAFWTKKTQSGNHEFTDHVNLNGFFL